MAAADLAEPISVRTILFGSYEESIDALQRTIASGQAASLLGDALATVSGTTRAAAVEEFSKVVSGLLAIDLTDTLVMGWRKHSALAAAARRTAEAPDTEELVDVATHEMSWAHEPYVELFVDELKVATVHMHLSLDLEVKALVVAISAGRLTAVHSGSCSLTAALAAEGVTMAERRVHVELPLVLHLGRGLALYEPASGVSGSPDD